MGIRIHHAGGGTDAFFGDHRSVAPEASDLLLQLVHFRFRIGIFLDGITKEKNDVSQEDTGAFVLREIVEAGIAGHAPLLRSLERNKIGVIAANGRRPFPQGAGNVRGEARREIARDDAHPKSSIGQTKSRGQAADARAEYENLLHAFCFS